MYPALGIDYGKSKIGLALTLGSLVEPLIAVSPLRIFSVLPHLVTFHNVKTLVIGLPDGPLRPEVIDFSAKLTVLFAESSVRIVFQDETLSTYDAQHLLFHTTSKRRHQREHSVAAAVILQTWLDSIQSSIVK
jgi:RNase H-fold protein (predicted Holliday junction resolvase)